MFCCCLTSLTRLFFFRAGIQRQIPSYGLALSRQQCAAVWPNPNALSRNADRHTKCQIPLYASKQFRDKGYVLLRGLASPEEVAFFREAVNRYAAHSASPAILYSFANMQRINFFQSHQYGRALADEKTRLHPRVALPSLTMRTSD